MSQYKKLIALFIFVAIAAWINFPVANHTGINIGNFSKVIDTHLGLDLVGGVQVLLEADLPEDTTIPHENLVSSMRTAASIVENRVNALGVEEAVVQQAGDQRIVVEIPGLDDPEQAIATIRETGLLEFVHFGDLFLPAGTIIRTDYGHDVESMLPPDFDPEDPDSSLIYDEVFNTVMTGAVLRTVNVITDEFGQYVIQFTLTPEGAEEFARYTTENVGSILGIVLDKRVISAPSVESPITEGSGVITGNFTLESANNLAVQLRYGSLPIPLKVVETRTVGPTLGEDSLQKSLIAGAIGFGIVILFMGLYYRLPGLLANLSMIFYAMILFALFRYIPVTLTLPGIAGLMLSTGGALDANILIFERLKEELRNGKTLVQAVEQGWKRAWPSIRDANISTLITCGVLFWFGSAFGATIVKGFALTLAIGVCVSVFSALFVTRTFMNVVLDYFKEFNYKKWFGV
ncbi:MAG: protein translocase subunit SecD [Anaerolineales bacterium]|nr:protein translocase subunit SecD [Anaerolineales bacterium]